MREGGDGVFVEGLQHCKVTSPREVFSTIAAGNTSRHVAGTNVNSRSSRSYTGWIKPTLRLV